MIRTSTALLLVFTLAPAAVPAATCAGANPAITSVSVKNVTGNGQLNTYHIVATVTNLGSQAQASNTLQFVDIYAETDKHDNRGIPPLAAGHSYTFGYDWQRSVDAGKGTTTVYLQMHMRQGSDCNPANGKNSITF
jgi:subtilase family serine protease